MKPRAPRVPPAATETVRHQIARRLEAGEASFEELRGSFLLKARVLEEHLRHIERSARGRGGRLRIVPASCAACGFVFRHRETRHLHPPGRCPECRSERIDGPHFQIEPAA